AFVNRLESLLTSPSMTESSSFQSPTGENPHATLPYMQRESPDTCEICARSVRSSVRVPRWYSPMVTFWTRHVCPSLEEGAYRDHLGRMNVFSLEAAVIADMQVALERTFLAYLRTSLILVMTGVIIAQLYHLQRSATPNPRYGFYVIGGRLSAVFIATAIVVLLVGAARFWRIQRRLLRGKTLTGGWEVMLIMGLTALLLIGTFALVLGVDIEKTYFNG
ncbi:hypothetical protein IAQ61_004187, partial [Plenodomus lingam]|uniref:uncharacterized protein n=1 Tax=Leptosphaeria maculans TaxID=5022 RepID=UPI003332D323